MKQKICILIGSHLATAPRPQKEAITLAQAGYDVVVLGSWWNPKFAQEDIAIAKKAKITFVPLIDLSKKNLRASYARVRNRLAREAFLKLGRVYPSALGLNSKEMLKTAASLNPDLIIAHSESAMWAGRQLKELGFKVAVDFEDWFSNDLMPADRKSRPCNYISQLEMWHLRYADFTLTTSAPLAEALAQSANTTKFPLVIPNVFPINVMPDHALDSSKQSGVCKFYWYSQTVGGGRGLESLGKALENVRGDWNLSLRGRLADSTWLDTTFAKSIRDRVEMLPLVTNEELLKSNAVHDVGLALEIPYCSNKDLTVSNKLFDYMRAGLAIVATQTKGQMWAFESNPDVGWTVPPNDVECLQAALQFAVDNPLSVLHAKHRAFHAAKSKWSWEHFANRLVLKVREALSQ